MNKDGDVISADGDVNFMVIQMMTAVMMEVRMTLRR